MLKKYLAKKAAKKSVSWMAKTEAKILYTAVASVATHQLMKAAAKKYPGLKILDPNEG